jgi:hypothetical protein
MGDLGDLEEVATVVRRMLAGTPTMYVCTSADNDPWGAGVFFAESDLFNLSLVLELHGRTLRNIRGNPRVALVVSSGNPFEPWLQGEAAAQVFEDKENISAVGDELRAKAPQSEPFLAVPLVAVRLRVTWWRVSDPANGWLPGKELPAPR